MFNIACRSGTKRARKENAEIVKMESLKRFSVTGEGRSTLSTVES